MKELSLLASSQNTIDNALMIWPSASCPIIGPCDWQGPNSMGSGLCGVFNCFIYIITVVVIAVLVFADRFQGSKQYLDILRASVVGVIVRSSGIGRAETLKQKL